MQFVPNVSLPYEMRSSFDHWSREASAINFFRCCSVNGEITSASMISPVSVSTCLGASFNCLNASRRNGNVSAVISSTWAAAITCSGSNPAFTQASRKRPSTSSGTTDASTRTGASPFSSSAV